MGREGKGEKEGWGNEKKRRYPEKKNSSLKTKFRVQNRSKERGSSKKVTLTSRIKYYSVVREGVFLG